MDSDNAPDSVLNFLTDEQLSVIPDEISSKLKEFIQECKLEKDAFHSTTERQKVDLEEADLELQNSKERVRVLESAEESLSKENATLRASVAELQEAKTKVELEINDTEGNRQTLTSLLEKRENELSDLRDQLSLMKTRCEHLTAELGSARVKQADAESSHTMLQAQLSRKETECMQLTEERYALDSEKLEYVRQISRLQMQKSAEMSNHHHSVEAMKNDLSNTQQLLETYKQQCESLSEKLRQEQARHRECRDNFIAAEESHRQELSSQKKLTQMYKEAEQKTSNELQDMHKTATEYKECFGQLTAEHEELIAQKRSELEEINSILSAKEDHIAQIESELARMNELMKESSESPDVTAELAKLIKSGLTYSQLYHKYHQTAEQLILGKAENARLNDCFNTLVKEIDVMRPQVVQLRAAHEASSNMVQKLSEQLKLNLENLDEEARKANEAKRQVSHYQKECHRFSRENEDLSTQVQLLVKEVHIAKGGRVVDDDSSAQVSSSTSQFMKSSDVISSQLVSFKDIQELQKQNQQLRAALREVSEAHDKVETSEESSRLTSKLEQDLANTRQEIEHFKQSRLKQEELVQSIIKQRDMYKELVAQGAMKEAQAKASPRRAITEVDNEKLQSLNDELKAAKEAAARIGEDFQKYKKEQTNSDSKLYNQIEQLNKELTEQKLSNAKLTTQLDYSLESSKVIEKNVTAYKQEINALRTKAEQYSNLVAKNESVATNLRQDLSRVQESSVKFEVANQQLRCEIDSLKTANRRLQVDADSAKKDYNLQYQMLSNLQSIQASIQHSNEEMKVHYQHKIEYLENDKKALEKQIASVKEDLQSAERHHAAEAAKNNGKVESLTEELKATKQKLVVSLEEQKLHRQGSVSKVGAQGMTSEDGSTGASDVEQSQDMLHAKSEIEALRDQLRLSGEASEEYRMAADKLELTLRELTAAGQEVQKSLESKNSQLQTEVDRLAARDKEMTQQYDTVFEQKSNLETEHAQMQGRLTAEVNELKSNLSVYKQKLESKELVEAKARADLQKASALSEELTAQYQAELERAIKLSEEVSSVKSEKDSLAVRVQELESDVLRLELQLQSNHASFEAREKEYQVCSQNLRQEISDSKEQTKQLHEQIEYFSRKHISESSQSQGGGAESEEENTARLLELVKVLRKDKELYETKLEVATAESKRLQAKVSFTEGELQQARGELAGERSQANIDIQTKAQHAELLRKVEQINVLTDSNRMLRQEKDSLQPKIDKLEKEVTELNTSIASLEIKSTELTMASQSLEGEKANLQRTLDYWKQRASSQLEKYTKDKAEEAKKHNAELEQLRKVNNNTNQQVQRLNTELNKLKTSLTASEEEKSQQAVKVEELKAQLATAESALVPLKEEMGKKDGMINELKRLGRKYKASYMKLVEEGKSAASGDDGKAAGTSAATTTPAVTDDLTSKLQAEVLTYKETVNAQDEEISKLKSDVEQLTNKSAESERQQQQVQEDLASEKEQRTKVSTDYEEVSNKHTQLKEFVANSLRPKVTKQKLELDKKQKEIVALQASKQQLEAQLEETQLSLDEAKAKLLSLEGKSSGSGVSAQSSLAPGGVDAKRTQAGRVRTIEVRPMAQPSKQPRATVMPTTSHSEPPEAVVMPTTSQTEPQEAVVLPTTSQSDTPEAVVMPTTSQTEPQEAVVLPTTSQSDTPEAVVMPTTSQSDTPEAVVMPTTSHAEKRDVLVVIHEEPMVGIVSPTSISSPNSNAISTSTPGATSSDSVPVAQLAPSAHSPTQIATSSTPVVSATPIVSAAAAILNTVQSVSPQTTQTSVVPPQVGIVASQSTDVPAVEPNSSVAVSAAASPNAVVTSATPVVSQVAAIVASQNAPFSAAVAQTSSLDQEQSSFSTLATSSTSLGGAGDNAAGSNEAEVSGVKRSRDNYEADDENEEPTVKRTKDDGTVNVVDDVTSQEMGAEQEQFLQEELDSNEGLMQVTEQQALPTSSLMHSEELSALHQSQPAAELPAESTQFGLQEQPGTSGKFESATSYRSAARQRPDADVVVILSSDEESDTEQQFARAAEAEEDDASESEMEPSTEEEEQGSGSEYAEEGDGEEVDGEEVDVGGTGSEGEDFEEEEEDDDDASSDIIMIEERPADPGNASGSVSSSQPSTSTNRRMASLSAAYHYQAQGTVSMDSNPNDDGIVPSTPTLSLPLQRNDGFAVAVSSPNPSQDPFMFAASNAPSGDFGELAQQATIMDDLPQIGDSTAQNAGAANLEIPVGSTSALEAFVSDMDSQQVPSASTSAFEHPSASTSTSTPFGTASPQRPTESTDVTDELPTESSDVMELPTESTDTIELPTESTDAIELPTESTSGMHPNAASTSTTEPTPASTSSEQSNVVSTDSELELHSSTTARATTDETVSSSEANASTHGVESVIRSEANQSGQPDMPSSSGQSSRPPTARRGRVRGARLNRPTFNKPQ